MPVRGAVSLAPPNPPARHQHRHGMGPVVTSLSLFTTTTRVADLRLAAHLAVDHHQGLVQQAAFGQVVQQCREAAVQLRQQHILEADEVIPVSIPAATTLAVFCLGQLLVPLPEDAHKGNPGFDQAAGHQHAHPVMGLAIPLDRRVRFPGKIKSRFCFTRPEQGEGFFLEGLQCSDVREPVKLALGAVEFVEQLPASMQTVNRNVSHQFNRRCCELHRVLGITKDIERIVFHSQPGSKLAWPRVLWGSRFAWQGDRLRQVRMRRRLGTNNRSDCRPVRGTWLAGIEQCRKAGIRVVASQVVVIPSMVIAGATAEMSQRSNHGQLVCPLREHWQVFAELEPGS